MANAIRALAMDAVQQANSGHPGAPMGMADMAVALWGRHLRHNPANPHWADRDRFVLSNGHGSMLLYALLHLTGYDLPIGELQQLPPAAQQDAGPPRSRHHARRRDHHRPAGPGPRPTRSAWRWPRSCWPPSSTATATPIVDHHTYVFLGDGCLMEGISHEACALAGAWKLNKLIALYDDNGISIDGQVAPWFIDDTPKRFEAYGWNVIGPIDGHDVEAVDRGDRRGATQSTDKPTLIMLQDARSARAAPNRANTAKAHGEALGADEIKLTRAALGWPHEPFERARGRLRRVGRARPRGAERRSRLGRALRRLRQGASRSWPPSSRAA